jgi:hypothetical protein
MCFTYHLRKSTIFISVVWILSSWESSLFYLHEISLLLRKIFTHYLLQDSFRVRTFRLLHLLGLVTAPQTLWIQILLSLVGYLFFHNRKKKKLSNAIGDKVFVSAFNFHCKNNNSHNNLTSIYLNTMTYTNYSPFSISIYIPFLVNTRSWNRGSIDYFSSFYIS